MLSVPAIAITAFGPVAATQEAEKTTVLSGKKFAQLHVWRLTIAKLLHLLYFCRFFLCKHLKRGGLVYQRCLLVRAKWGRSGNDCLLASFD